MRIRELKQSELDLIWSVDRAETVDEIYLLEGDELVLKPDHVDIRGWPPGERDQYGPILADCYDRGGTFFGAFDDDRLTGVAVLESLFIGPGLDQLQLKFLHVSNSFRGTGLGRELFQRSVNRARAMGARLLYISATPSKNTIDFYLHLGCRLARPVDPDLYELEPEDIHLEYEIPS